MDKLVEKNNKGAHNLVYPYDILPQPGRMLKISDGVYWVRMNLPFALNHINLWVLKDNDGWAIVDTGVASAEIKSNWRTCFSGDMGSQKVNKVIGPGNKFVAEAKRQLSGKIIGTEKMYAAASEICVLADNKTDVNVNNINNNNE